MQIFMTSTLVTVAVDAIASFPVEYLRAYIGSQALIRRDIGSDINTLFLATALVILFALVTITARSKWPSKIVTLLRKAPLRCKSATQSAVSKVIQTVRVVLQAIYICCNLAVFLCSILKSSIILLLGLGNLAVNVIEVMTVLYAIFYTRIPWSTGHAPRSFCLLLATITCFMTAICAVFSPFIILLKLVIEFVTQTYTALQFTCGAVYTFLRILPFILLGVSILVALRWLYYSVLRTKNQLSALRVQIPTWAGAKADSYSVRFRAAIFLTKSTQLLDYTPAHASSDQVLELIARRRNRWSPQSY